METPIIESPAAARSIPQVAEKNLHRSMDARGRHRGVVWNRGQFPGDGSFYAADEFLRKDSGNRVLTKDRKEGTDEG